MLSASPSCCRPAAGYRKFGATSLAPVNRQVVTITDLPGFASLDHNSPLASTRSQRGSCCRRHHDEHRHVVHRGAARHVAGLHLRWRLTLKFPAWRVRRASGLAIVGSLVMAADITACHDDLATATANTGRPRPGQLREPSVHRGLTGAGQSTALISAFPVRSATQGDAFDKDERRGSNRSVMRCPCENRRDDRWSRCPRACPNQKSDQVAALTSRSCFRHWRGRPSRLSQLSRVL